MHYLSSNVCIYSCAQVSIKCERYLVLWKGENLPNLYFRREVSMLIMTRWPWFFSIIVWWKRILIIELSVRYGWLLFWCMVLARSGRIDTLYPAVTSGPQNFIHMIASIRGYNLHLRYYLSKPIFKTTDFIHLSCIYWFLLLMYIILLRWLILTHCLKLNFTVSFIVSGFFIL